MLGRLVWAPILAAGLGLAAAGVAGAQPGPQELVERVNSEVMQVLEERGDELAEAPVAMYEALAPIIEPHIDYDHLGEQLLGPHWRSANEATRQRFIEQFQRSLVRSYASSLDDLDSVDTRILGTRQRNGTVQVGMEVGTGDSRTRVIYQLHQRDGAWLLTDVIAEGVSLVHNYREDFRSRLRDQDLEAVIEQMAERNQEMGFE